MNPTYLNPTPQPVRQSPELPPLGHVRTWESSPWPTPCQGEGEEV